MSYALSVQLSSAPELASLLRDLGEGVHALGEVPARGWPEGSVHLHRVGRSTRGIEILREGERLTARMLACASGEDWRLALATFEALAGPEAAIEGEDGTAAVCATAATDLAEIIESETASAIATIEAMVAAGRTIELEGPVRRVHFGARMLSDLGGDPRELLEAIRRVQYIEAEGYEVIEYHDLASKLGLGTDVGGFSLWDPTRAQAFEPAPLLGIECDEPGLYIPASSAPEVAGDRFTWLDERQFAVAPTPAEELPMLVARAKERRVDPHARMRGLAGGGRKWWQFWRR